MRPHTALALAALAAALVAPGAAATKPTFTTPPAVDWEWTSNAALSVTAQIDVAGRLRCVALTTGATPTVAEVITGGANPTSNVVSKTSTTPRATIDGLEADTVYQLWCVAEDAGGDRQVDVTKSTGVSITAPVETWQHIDDDCNGAHRNRWSG
jgi:hypothetical protein